MLAHRLAQLRRFASRCVAAVRAQASAWTRPCPLAAGLAAGTVRSCRELLLENTLLRQQVIILRRTAKRPTFTRWDRGLLVLLASRLRTWASALLIVQPETVPR